ncbi:MAG: ABC transporter ATP-binding protein [Clostridiaceae bacterium]
MSANETRKQKAAKSEEERKASREKSKKTLKRIFSEARPIRGWLTLSALVSMLSVAMVLIGPELLGKQTDVLYEYWANNTTIDMASFINRCLVLAGIYLLSGICGLATMFIMNNVVSKLFTCELRIRMSDKIRRLAVKFVDDTPKGEVISRMTNDVSVLGNTVHTVLDLTISGIIKLVGITVIVFTLQPLMALSVVVLVPLSLTIASLISQKSEKHFADGRESIGKIYALNEEDFAGFATIKAFHLEDRQKRVHETLVDAAKGHLESGYYLSGIVQPIVALTNNLAYIAICLLGGALAIAGTINVGDVVAFVLYAKLFAGPLESISSGLSTMQHTLASAGRVYDLLDREEMVQPADRPLPQGGGNIRFEHVNFAYDPAKPLIQDLNIDVRPGQKVAIVGPTGGGKTTIVNLLMRFYDVDSGRITIDGVDTKSMDRADLRTMFSMVLQDTWLFSGTIYENIAYGKAGATREEVLEAARRAHIDFFIETLPDGYETVINEESTNVSSGQKQLLTIARAYLANRNILILDEATSNVDTRTEILIQQTMDELMRARTSFVIAHRLSTIVNADTILVVNDGQIVEQGTHMELLAKNGFYAEIYNSQYALLN